MNTLYIDMDGVVADFDTTARAIMKATFEENRLAEITGRWPDHKWREILNHKNFFRILPKMPMADELIYLARKFETDLGWQLRMLTAIPKKNDFPDAFQDKIDWMQEHYPGIRVHFGPYSQDKQHHCKPGDILVDDRTSNIMEWRQAGGIGIQVTKDYGLAIEQLQQEFDLIRKRQSTS